MVATFAQLLTEAAGGPGGDGMTAAERAYFAEQEPGA